MKELKEIVKDLIEFKTVSGNLPEITKCLAYCERLFEGTGAKVRILKEEGISPVLYITNQETMTPDVAVLGHLDVVPAEEDQFVPVKKEGCLYARGALDMKSFAAVAFGSMAKVVQEKWPLSFAVILTTDEEVGSRGMTLFEKVYPDFCPKIVLDNDVGGDILKIVDKCKQAVFVKLKASGQAVHGSTPWEGTDANERLMQMIANLRKIYPYYTKDNAPKNTWINTMHVGKISGGSAANIVSASAEALLDFRLTETYGLERLKQDLTQAQIDGVDYEIVSAGIPVVMDRNNPVLKKYKALAEEELGQEITFEQIGGATDSKTFAAKGALVIYHSGTGEGMHGADEYVEWDSVEKLAVIQEKFLKSLAGV